MIAYLDNSATTKCDPKVAEVMMKVLTEDYGNPSSMHTKGFEAEQYIRAAKETFAKILKVNAKEIYFTSGGTESNNMALIGAALANQRAGKHIITSAIEHPSVSQVTTHLEEQGFEITYLPVNEEGCVELETFQNAMREDTILVSIMMVNNEIGSLQPIEALSKIAKSVNKHVVVHVDAVQGFGKFRIAPKRMGIDMLSISSHKIHGPKGNGVLYIGDKVKIRPIVFGGGQQEGIRSGTENVPGIAGMAKAAELVYEDFEQHQEVLYRLREYFIEQVQEIPDVRINGPKGREGACHVVSVSFRGVRSEVLLHTLEEYGIFVSAGSACSSNKPGLSSTLVNIGVPKELLDSTIRFSFSVYTTKEELDYCLETLKQVLPALRRYARH